MPQWTPAFSLDQLPVGGSRLFKRGRDQVAVFRLEEDELYAIDNRCPHEGYPLIQGAQDGCTLTCCWHNYKFDLRDGACIKGEEAVRTFPVRVREGEVHLDLEAPDPAAAIPGLWESLGEAMHEDRQGQAIRDAIRLIEAGVSPVAICAWAAAYDGRHAEYGATHALAVAADTITLLPRYPGLRAAVPLGALLELAAEPNVRRTPRPKAEAVDPGADPVAAGARLRACVEAEDAVGAEEILRGALARGWRRAELEPWFTTLCVDHFLSFGHRLIYQVKVFDLLDAADWAHAEDILCGHLFGILSGTREDVLPTWNAFRRDLDKTDLDALWSAADSDPDWSGGPALMRALLGGSAREAFGATTAALTAGAPLLAVVDTLSLAAAERMLRFDVAIDSDPSVQDNWLSVSHIQTFVHAVRHALQRQPEAATLRLVLYAARFINHHRVLDGDRASLDARPVPAAALVDAVRHKDTDTALAGTLAAWRDGGLDELEPVLLDLMLSDLFARPIVVAHAIKNSLVALAEARITGDPRPLLAAVRLVASPLQQRWTHRRSLESIAFIQDGTVPKLLAP